MQEADGQPAAAASAEGGEGDTADDATAADDAADGAAAAGAADAAAGEDAEAGAMHAAAARAKQRQAQQAAAAAKKAAVQAAAAQVRGSGADEGTVAGLPRVPSCVASVACLPACLLYPPRVSAPVTCLPAACAHILFEPLSPACLPHVPTTCSNPCHLQVCRHYAQGDVARLKHQLMVLPGEVDLLLTCEWPAGILQQLPAGSADLPGGEEGLRF